MVQNMVRSSSMRMRQCGETYLIAFFDDNDDDDGLGSHVHGTTFYDRFVCVRQTTTTVNVVWDVPATYNHHIYKHMFNYYISGVT